MSSHKKNHSNYGRGSGGPRAPGDFKARGPGFGFEGNLLQLGGAIVLGLSAIFGYREIKRYEDDRDARCKFKREQDFKSYERAGPPLEVKSGAGTNSPPVKTWQEDFREKHQFPHKYLPPVIFKLFDGIPPGYEDAVLVELLSMIGALCFSKVRAIYLDGKKHAANLMVVIEGTWGSGKSIFDTLYRNLFGTLIERDNIKRLQDKSTTSSKTKHIVQNLGISVTRAKFNEILSGNRGVHVLFFDEELEAVVKVKSENKSLTSEHFRKAFDNGTVSQDNMSKNAVSGIFPVYANMVFTGTPYDVTDFAKNEISGGTVSRFIWSSIPESGRRPPVLNLPEETVEKLIGNIEVWNSTYCYTTDADGSDIPCPEYEIKLPEVNKGLDKWLEEQYQQSQTENNPARADVRTRSAAIAFHCAIVLAMLYDYPGGLNKRSMDSLVALTIYLADYIQERFLHKFGSEHNIQRTREREAERVKVSVAQNATQGKPKDKKSSLDMAKLKAEHDSGIGWDTLGKKYGCTGTYIKKLIRKYEAGLDGAGTSNP